MSNETHYPMFEAYLSETLPDETPIEEVLSRRRQMISRAQQDLLQKVKRDADMPVLEDPYEEMEHFARERINKAIRERLPEPPPPAQSPPSFLEDELLAKVLGTDQLDKPVFRPATPPRFQKLPKLVDARSLGREPLPRGPALLDLPVPDIFEQVAGRSTTGRARDFALMVAENARELERMP